MNFTHFSRKLREKYPTKFHLAEQLIDRNQSLKSSSESPVPLVTVLHQINQPFSNRLTKKIVTNSCETYLNECLVAAQQVQRRRQMERNRQLCYENFLLAEKLKSMEKKNCPKSKEIEKSSTSCRSRCKSLIGDKRNLFFVALNPNGNDSSVFNEEDQLTVADVDSSFDDRSRHCRKRHICRRVHSRTLPVCNVPRAFEKRILFE